MAINIIVEQVGNTIDVNAINEVVTVNVEASDIAGSIAAANALKSEIARDQAIEAKDQAFIAKEAIEGDLEQTTINAANALQSANNALASELIAEQAKTDATTQAGIATTQAGIATTQAGEAITQAGIATTQAGIATDQAVISTNAATTSTNQAVLSTTARNEAEAFKNTANAERLLAETARDASETFATQSGVARDQAIQSNTNTQSLLVNFFDPEIIALNLRGIAEGASFEIKLRHVQDDLDLLRSLNPSLVLIPSVQKAGTLYSVVPENGTGDFSVSRNGTATYLGADGLLKTAQPNEPRLEFNPDGSFKGVLIEPSATNLVLRSEQLNVSSWGQIGVSVNLETGLFIGISYFKIVGNGTSTVPRNQQVITVAPNQDIVISFFVKKNNWDFICINQSAFSGSIGAIDSFFDLENGTTPTVGASINPVGNGWYRVVSAPFQAIPTDTSGLISINITPSISSRFWSSAQLNNELSFLATGAQLEFGSVATSYIPTVASTVTRPADIITVQEPNNITEIKTINNNIQEVTQPTGGLFQLPNGYIQRVVMI